MSRSTNGETCNLLLVRKKTVLTLDNVRDVYLRIFTDNLCTKKGIQYCIEDFNPDRIVSIINFLFLVHDNQDNLFILLTKIHADLMAYSGRDIGDFKHILDKRTTNIGYTFRVSTTKPVLTIDKLYDIYKDKYTNCSNITCFHPSSILQAIQKKYRVTKYHEELTYMIHKIYYYLSNRLNKIQTEGPIGPDEFHSAIYDTFLNRFKHNVNNKTNTGKSMSIPLPPKKTPPKKSPPKKSSPKKPKNITLEDLKSMYKKIKVKFPVENARKVALLVHPDKLPLYIQNAMVHNITLSSNVTMVLHRLSTYIPINDKEMYDEIIDEIFVDLPSF